MWYCGTTQAPVPELAYGVGLSPMVVRSNRTGGTESRIGSRLQGSTYRRINVEVNSQTYKAIPKTAVGEWLR